MFLRFDVKLEIIETTPAHEKAAPNAYAAISFMLLELTASAASCALLAAFMIARLSAVSDGAEIAKEIADITISAESLYEVVALKQDRKSVV